jgi:hypothetical protein
MYLARLLHYLIQAPTHGRCNHDDSDSSIGRMTMTKYAIAFAATFFTASVTAGNVYQGLAQGNPDLSSGDRTAAGVVGIQPGVGDSFDIYNGLADLNDDLFGTIVDTKQNGPRPDIYHNLRGNPDLRF